MKSFLKKNGTKLLVLVQPFWLEFFLHVFADCNLMYAPIYGFFGLALGCLFGGIYALLAIKLSNKSVGIIAKAVSVILWLVYCIELMCKLILQTFYSFSILSTAAENRLGDYIGQIIKVVTASIPAILILAVPTILLFIFRRKEKGVLDYSHKYNIISGFAFFLILHLCAVGIINVTWPGDLQPRELYTTDTDIIDQVEQLGLMTMLRLDVQHQIVPAESSGEDFVAVTPPPVVTAEKTETAEPETVSEAAIAATEPAIVIDTSPNVMDVDLAAVSENASNKDVKWLADYFSSLTPTNKNEYTGKYKDYNVIFILMESFTGYVIDPVYTPTLYKLSTEGYIFDNFYTALHYTSTSNGECQTLLGLYPKNGNPVSMKRTGELGTNTYFSLASQLNRLGYNSYGYHNNWDLYGRMGSHNNLGYSWRFATRGLDMEWKANNELKWPQRDSFMIEHSVDQYINDDHFNIYYLTVSQHTPYSWNWVASQYKEQLADAPYSEETKAYIATAMEVDKAFAELIDALDEAGKLENTLICACADHVPYSGVEIMEELTGESFGDSAAVRAINEQAINFDIYKNTLFLWTPSIEEPVHIDKVCCQVDILPTLSNLLGLEYDSRMLAGKDIFSTDEGMVVFSSRCWKTDLGFYNRYTQEFTPNEGVDLSGYTEEELEQYIEYNKAQAQNKIDMTSKIIENDFYDILFGEE